jgi:hypothetical protein
MSLKEKIDSAAAKRTSFTVTVLRWAAIILMFNTSHGFWQTLLYVLLAFFASPIIYALYFVRYMTPILRAHGIIG